MIAAAFSDETRGFAADDEGGLFLLDRARGHVEEIDRDADYAARIRGLGTVIWK